MSSLQKPLNRLIQPIWSKRSTSKSALYNVICQKSVCKKKKIHFYFFEQLDSRSLPNIIINSRHPIKSCRVVRNPNYGWRALRLLSRRSPHFFQPTNQKFKSLADYLDSMVSKLAKELPVRDLFTQQKRGFLK